MPTTISGSDGVDKVQDGIVTDNKLNLTANSAEVKEAVNASGSAPIYACRAWVNFNGTGTVAIRASGNVTSITDSGTGQYIVNFTNSMPDTNYCAVVNTRRSDGGGTADPNVGCSVKSGTTYPLSTSACPVVTGSANDGVARDFDYCAVSVFR